MSPTNLTDGGGPFLFGLNSGQATLGFTQLIGHNPQATRAGKAGRRVKEHSGHESWGTFNQYVEEAGTFQDNPAEDIGL